MADNIEVKAASTVPVATDVVTYSGDASQNVQLVRLVGVTGAEGSKTVVDPVISAAFADGESNTQVAHATEAYNMLFNGTTWDRVRGDTTNGAWVNIKASAAVPVTDNAGSITVDAPVGTPAFVRLSDGASAITTLPVSLASVPSHAVTNAGTFATQVDGAALTSLQLIDDTVIADDAAFTPATTKVIMAGFTLDNTSTDPIDEGDAGAARITTDRRQIVALGEAGANYVKGGGSKTDTTAQSLMAASGDAAISNFLCWVTVYNSSATNTAVEIRDGTSTVVAVLPAPAYSGSMFQPTYPIKMTANTATNAYSQASVTTLYVYGGGYKAV